MSDLIRRLRRFLRWQVEHRPASVPIDRRTLPPPGPSASIVTTPNVLPFRKDEGKR
jgi:hypothetical protein